MFVGSLCKEQSVNSINGEFHDGSEVSEKVNNMVNVMLCKTSVRPMLYLLIMFCLAISEFLFVSWKNVA